MNKTTITRDLDKRTLTIARRFDAPREIVWRAYTEPALLDRWWAPSPWQTETLHMDLTVGGYWHYAMKGPDGGQHFGRMDFLEIEAGDHYRSLDVFADESGAAVPDMPRQTFTTTFSGDDDTTDVLVVVNYENVEDLRKVIEMGIEQGVTMAQDQLETLLQDPAFR